MAEDREEARWLAFDVILVNLTWLSLALGRTWLPTMDWALLGYKMQPMGTELSRSCQVLPASASFAPAGALRVHSPISACPS